MAPVDSKARTVLTDHSQYDQFIHLNVSDTNFVAGIPNFTHHLSNDSPSDLLIPESGFTPTNHQITVPEFGIATTRSTFPS